MRTGKLQISRGCDLAAATGQAPRLSLVAAVGETRPTGAGEAAEVEDDAGHQTVLARLEMLERLARLRSLELLSAEEYEAEKAVILSRQSEVRAFLSEAEKPIEPKAVAGPSLAGRLFSWKLVPISLVAGLAFSFGVQPQETLRFVDQALSVIGA